MIQHDAGSWLNSSLFLPGNCLRSLSRDFSHMATVGSPLQFARQRRGGKDSFVRVPGKNTPVSSPTRFPGSERSSPGRRTATPSNPESRPVSPKEWHLDMSVIDGLRPTVTQLLRSNHAELPAAPVQQRPHSATHAPIVRTGVTGRFPRPQSALLDVRPRSAPRSHPRHILSICRDDDTAQPSASVGQLIDQQSESQLQPGWQPTGKDLGASAEVSTKSLRPPADAVPRPRRIVEKPCSPAVLVDVRGSVVEVRSRMLDAALKQPALTGTTRWRLEMARMVELEQQSRLAPFLICKSSLQKKRLY